MAKFRVNVCLRPTATADVNATLAAAMAPFDINLTDDWNPVGEWDWWRVDAGPGYRFAVIPGHEGDPRLIHGDDVPEPLHCDGGPRGLLDFDAMRRQAIDRAHAEWQARQRDFRKLVADHPPAQPLTAFVARHAVDTKGYPREQAVADHHAQPLVRALNHRTAWERYPSLGVWVLGPNSDPITRFAGDPQPDMDRVVAWAVTTFALLTLEGQWIEPVQLGPFAEIQDGEDADSAYSRQYSDYLDNLDEDCIIVRLLCHC